MDRQQRFLIGLLAASAITLSGCAGTTPFAYLGARRALNLTQSKKPEALAAQQNLAESQSTYSGTALGQRPFAPPKQGVTETVTAAMKKASQSVTSALTVKPKVIPADDPIRLTSHPGPIDADLYVSAGRIHEQRGNFEAAKDQYRRALDVDANNLTALLCFGRIHDRLERFDEAVKIYRRAVEAHPKCAVALNDLGLCYARQDQLELSMQVLRQAVQLDPEKALYRNNLATVLVEAGQVREAYEHLATVHGPAVAHYNLGYFLYQRNANEQAAQHFTKAIEIDPALAAARHMLIQLGAVPPANRQSYYIGDREDRSHEVPATVSGLTDQAQQRELSR